MRFFTIIYLLCFSVLGNENSLKFKLIFKKEKLNKNIKAVDNFNNIYSIINNELIKSSDGGRLLLQEQFIFKYFLN